MVCHRGVKPLLRNLTRRLIKRQKCGVVRTDSFISPHGACDFHPAVTTWTQHFHAGSLRLPRRATSNFFDRDQR